MFFFPDVANKIYNIVLELAIYQKEKDPINILKEEIIFVSFINKSQNCKIFAKVYLVGIKDKEVINKVFDILYTKDIISYIINFTLFKYTIFVVYYIINKNQLAIQL